MMEGYNERQDGMVVRCRGLADWYYGCWCHTDSRLDLACLRIRHTLEWASTPLGRHGWRSCKPLSSFPSISQRMIMATSGKARQHRAILRLCSLHSPPKISNFPWGILAAFAPSLGKMENTRAPSPSNLEVKVTSGSTSSSLES